VTESKAKTYQPPGMSGLVCQSAMMLRKIYAINAAAPALAIDAQDFPASAWAGQNFNILHMGRGS
jgi:hypothetical protein